MTLTAIGHFNPLHTLDEGVQVHATAAARVLRQDAVVVPHAAAATVDVVCIVVVDVIVIVVAQDAITKECAGVQACCRGGEEGWL